MSDIVKTADLRPGDFVVCLSRLYLGQHFLVTEVDGNWLSATPVTKHGRPDKRYVSRWSGSYRTYKWQILHRGVQ